MYGIDAIFLASLGAPVSKFLQEQEVELNPIQRRINQLVEVQQTREGVLDKSPIFQDRMKKIFDKRAKPDDFQQGDWVLKWDSRYEDKGKHGKFDHIWKGPYKITVDQGNNTYVLQEVNGDFMATRPINGHFLKHYPTK